jgi:hypothetical protein
LISYQSFDDPETGSPPWLYEKFVKIIEYGFKDDLAGFITKVGDYWNAAAL